MALLRSGLSKKDNIIKDEKNSITDTNNVNIQFDINIKHIVATLFVITFALSLASITFKTNLTGHKYIVNLFDLDSEMNLPTFFSSFILLIASALFLNISQSWKRQGDKQYRNWFFLAVIFVALSADEFMSLHEQTTQFFRHTKLGSFIHFGWLIPAAVLLVLFILKYIKFFFHLSRKFRKLFFASAFLFVWGAMGMELFSGIYQNYFGQENTIYFLMTNVEETFEMLGTVLLIYSLLTYIKEVEPENFTSLS